VLSEGHIYDAPEEQAAALVDYSKLSGDPERSLRDFMYALYANDTIDYQKHIVPHPGSTDLIGSQTFTAEQLTKLRSQIADLVLEQTSPFTLNGQPLGASTPPFPLGTKTMYFTEFRGMMLAIPMLYTEEGWKTDVRFWLAMMKQQETEPKMSDPEMVAKRFLFHILAKEPEALNELASSQIQAEQYTSENHLPRGDLDQILSLCIEMPIVKAREGEGVLLPSGDFVSETGDPDSLVLIGLMGPVEVPFLLKRVNSEWKVVPQMYFEMLRKAGAI
jgi:hypothetical protein